MFRVSGGDKRAPSPTKQISFTHITQNAVAAGAQSAALQFGGHGTMTIVGHRQSNLLNPLASSLFGRGQPGRLGLFLSLSVIARPRDRHRRTELFDGSCAGVCLARDLSD